MIELILLFALSLIWPLVYIFIIISIYILNVCSQVELLTIQNNCAGADGVFIESTVRLISYRTLFYWLIISQNDNDLYSNHLKSSVPVSPAWGCLCFLCSLILLNVMWWWWWWIIVVFNLLSSCNDAAACLRLHSKLKCVCVCLCVNIKNSSRCAAHMPVGFWLAGAGRWSKNCRLLSAADWAPRFLISCHEQTKDLFCVCENLLTRASRSLPVSPANQVKGHNCVRINRSGRLSIFRKVSAALRALRRPDAALPVSSELVFNNPPPGHGQDETKHPLTRQCLQPRAQSSHSWMCVLITECSRPVAEYVRRAVHINTQTKGNAPSRTLKWTRCIRECSVEVPVLLTGYLKLNKHLNMVLSPSFIDSGVFCRPNKI